jgi:hypothetical protein
MESDVITAKTLASANAAVVPKMFRAFHVDGMDPLSNRKFLISARP